MTQSEVSSLDAPAVAVATVVNGHCSNSGTGPKKTKFAVYCGASPGNRPEHLAMARELANSMHKHGIELVFGGGSVGVMGELAKTLVSLSGPDAVHGVIPQALIQYERSLMSKDPDKPVPAPDAFGRTTVVPDMHTRKAIMAREVIEGGPGSGFVALGGGFGTVEELFETATWNQLGIHRRGICLINVGGFWDGILDWIRHASQEGFISESNRSIVVSATDAEGAIKALRDYKVSEGVMKLQWGTQ